VLPELGWRTFDAIYKHTPIPWNLRLLSAYRLVAHATYAGRRFKRRVFQRNNHPAAQGRFQEVGYCKGLMIRLFRETGRREVLCPAGRQKNGHNLSQLTHHVPDWLIYGISASHIMELYQRLEQILGDFPTVLFVFTQLPNGKQLILLSSDVSLSGPSLSPRTPGPDLNLFSPVVSHPAEPWLSQ
jgi:hypothetical protein